jgi:hypothetical protein
MGGKGTTRTLGEAVEREVLVISGSRLMVFDVKTVFQPPLKV